MSSALSGRDITVRYGDKAVLADVDVEIHHGEVMALVGPNGAGKSTLLGVLAGDITVNNGAVHVLGRGLAEWKLRDLARNRAVLTQEHHLAFPFPVQQVVEMGRAPWRGRPEEDLDDLEVAAAMHVTDVTHLAHRSYASLSGGEKGRASFARVLAQQTDIVMLDEPTAALDLGHQETVMATARRSADAGAAVVVVLHDLSLAAAWSDRIMLLEKGRVVGDGAPAEVLRSDLLSRVYGYPIDVISHPRTGELLVLPDRAAAAAARATSLEENR